MHPEDLSLFGVSVSVWNAAFVLGVLAGAAVFVRSARQEPRIGWKALRYAVVVYLGALAAQLFAYAFDANGSLWPPPGRGFASWYLDPVAGPKTLFGTIVLMPGIVWVANLRTRVPLATALDLFTPAMFVVLGGARIGCFLQGCCYGLRSEIFGIRFPAGSPAYWQQVAAGSISRGDVPLPVIPAQLVEALFLLGVAAWCLRAERSSAGPALFLRAILAYSIFRFAIEFVRADVERGFYGPLSTSQWISILVVAAGTGLLMRARRADARPTPAPTAPTAGIAGASPVEARTP